MTLLIKFLFQPNAKTVCFREEAEKQEDVEEDLIKRAEADFFAVIEAETMLRETKEKQQMESLKQMKKTLTGEETNGGYKKSKDDDLREEDEVCTVHVYYRTHIMHCTKS